jgi:polyhydroxyalkanoate synthesis regulator phasin
VNQLDGLKRYLEAATTLTQITRGRAEELVRDLVASGELEVARAQEWIEDLMRRSREASDLLVTTVSAEVDRQLGDRGLKNLDLDDLAKRVAGIIEHAGTVGRTVSVPKVWSRKSDNVAGQTPSEHKASTNGKKKPSSGKKKDSAPKDGSAKSSAKAGKKSPEAKKAQSKKTEKPQAQGAHGQGADKPAEPADHGVAT